ncbi:MAG TPA: hypothetical protein VFI31_00795 [Pirellulales bacterium]|nr:hypothetical protein [Pirellulales bacterium]
MTTKTIDDHGRLALGLEFAGQTVMVDDSNPDRIVITRATPPYLSQDEEEAAEWADLERRALPAERLDAIAEFLRSTGQASA